MKLYVGTYAKYNSGSLAGDWLNLDDYSNKDGATVLLLLKVFAIAQTIVITVEAL